MRTRRSWDGAPRTTPGGQPWHPALALLAGPILRAVFRLALHRTGGLVGSIVGLLGLALAAADHSTLSRRAKTLEARRPQPCRNGEPMHLLVDGTGLRPCGAGEWLQEKHGIKVRRSWRKLHVGLDERRAAEVNVAVHALNRMVEMGRPISVRIA